MPGMIKYIRDLEVAENRIVNDDFFVLTLKTGYPVPEILPGQFIQLRIDGSSNTFLRRPFSVFDWDGNGTIKILVKIAGPGTARLAEYRKGDIINGILPLGNSFTIPGKGQKVLLAGGGCGIAPLLFLGKIMKSRGIEPVFILGFKNRKSILETGTFRKTGQVFITTEDGSEGEKGYLTGHSLFLKGNFDHISCCGPLPMMKAVAAYAAGRKIECEVSLENLMACGFGVCLCCVEETTRGNVCSCTEGPVFNIKELKWQT